MPSLLTRKKRYVYTYLGSFAAVPGGSFEGAGRLRNAARKRNTTWILTVPFVPCRHE